MVVAKRVSGLAVCPCAHVALHARDDAELARRAIHRVLTGTDLRELAERIATLPAWVTQAEADAELVELADLRLRG